MASYYDDHSLEDPFKARKKTNNLYGGSSLNPDLSHFMPREETESTSSSPSSRSPSASGPAVGDFRRLAEYVFLPVIIASYLGSYVLLFNNSEKLTRLVLLYRQFFFFS